MAAVWTRTAARHGDPGESPSPRAGLRDALNVDRGRVYLPFSRRRPIQRRFLRALGRIAAGRRDMLLAALGGLPRWASLACAASAHTPAAARPRAPSLQGPRVGGGWITPVASAHGELVTAAASVAPLPWLLRAHLQTASSIAGGGGTGASAAWWCRISALAPGCSPRHLPLAPRFAAWRADRFCAGYPASCPRRAPHRRAVLFSSARSLSTLFLASLRGGPPLFAVGLAAKASAPSGCDGPRYRSAPAFTNPRPPTTLQRQRPPAAPFLPIALLGMKTIAAHVPG